MKKLQIGNVTLDNPVILAPMAGVSDLPFRLLCREMGAALVGDLTSGSVDHFGSTGSFTLPNTGVRVSMSTKFIDTGTLLECAAGLGVEPIQPDVTVYQTLEDYLAGQDTLVDALCARTEPFQPQERPDAPLSRGRLTELLRQAAEQPLLFCKLRPPRRFPALCCRNSCQRIDQPCDIFLAVCPGNNALRERLSKGHSDGSYGPSSMWSNYR